MSEMDYSRLPREAAEAFNPMIGGLPEDTLHGIANILVFLADALSEGPHDTGRSGTVAVLEAAQFALRYEANRSRSDHGIAAQTTEHWSRMMLARPVENVRAKLILMLLAADADADGNANASPALLARRAGMGEAHALTALRWLEKNKFIALRDEPAFTAILHA